MLTVDNPKKFDWANMDLSDCCEALKLFDLIMERLGDQPVMKLLEGVVMPSLETFAEMEYNGLDVDMDTLESVGKQLRTTNMDEEDFLYTCKGVTKTDNLSSNNDLIEILYTRENAMGLYPPDKTAKGKPSVSAPTLKLLLEHIDAELERRV